MELILFMDVISIREISDNNSAISSTRWGFATIIKFDVIAILLSIVAYIVAHFIGKPFTYELFTGVSLLLGILTGILTVAKAAQGFEPHRNDRNA